MVYRLIKWWVMLTHVLYFRKTFKKLDSTSLITNGRGKLFAANHPNSFIDPMSLAIQLPFPIHFLVRGDALKGRIGKFLMNYLGLMPVWREQEGRDNLKSNYGTFTSCLELWKKGGAVIIFSEGLCVNEWKLRPLPKGTARLAYQAWSEGLSLDIIPTVFNYSNFSGPGKMMTITTLPPLDYAAIFEAEPQPAIAQKQFNELLRTALATEVWDAPDAIEAAKNLPQPNSKPAIKKGLHFLVMLLHGLYYWPVKRLIKKKAESTVHYDAALFAVLMVTYPIFLLLIGLAIRSFGIDYFFVWLLIWPLSAWMYTRS